MWHLRAWCHQTYDYNFPFYSSNQLFYVCILVFIVPIFIPVCLAKDFHLFILHKAL